MKVFKDSIEHQTLVEIVENSTEVVICLDLLHQAALKEHSEATDPAKKPELEAYWRKTHTWAQAATEEMRDAASALRRWEQEHGKQEG